MYKHYTLNQNDCDTQSPHYNTPQVVDMDVLGRPFQTKDDNGENGAPIYYITHNKLDITGRPLVVTDALERTMTQNRFGLSEQNQIYVENIDSGKRWILIDTAGNPRYNWDSRNHRIQTNYDALLRHTQTLLKTGSATEKNIQNITYGTSVADNNIGQIIEIKVQDGKTSFAYDFKGNVIEQQKQFAEDYQNELDWSGTVTLINEVFTTETTYDALNRPVTLTQPDSSIITYNYDKGGLLQQVLHGTTIYISDIIYNEKGQREHIYYENNTKTRFYYNPLNLRLTRILTTKNSGADVLQDLNYTYDAAGNIIGQTDNAQQTFYFDNQVVAPTGTYQYDALYRLIQATGRELTALQMPTHDDFANNIPCPDTATNAMQNYTQHYQYDALGNMLQMQSLNQWTRDYIYDTLTNKLLKHDINDSDVYFYDNHGNMLSMPHLSSLAWDYLDQLHSATNGTFTSYYNYDSEGNRTRKVVIKGSVREERYYIGGYEVYRKYTGTTLNLERTTLNISDDEKVFVCIEIKTGESPIIRYQYDNHLGSACLELDDTGQIISYEEYHPFGTTSYRSGRSETEVSLKRYKYCGKERDEETGLYYYGMRYYAAWLCRFVSVDPLQFEYPHYTPYQYAGNMPITVPDLDGGEPDKETGKIHATVYFQFEQELELTPEQQQEYIDKFRENVRSVWNAFEYEGKQVNVDEVVFALAPKGMSENKLGSYQFLLTVGEGYTAKEDTIKGVSYVERLNNRLPKIGYMYYNENPDEAAHEFGHLLGLADRYVNVMLYGYNKDLPNPFILEEGGVLPLVFPNDKDFDPITNLMSSREQGTTLSQEQLSYIFNQKVEKEYPAPVILAPNIGNLPAAVSVTGSGVDFTITQYKMSNGILKPGNTSVSWAAMKGFMSRPKTTSTHEAVRNVANFSNIRKRTR